MNVLSIKEYKNCYALPIKYFKTEDGLDLHGGGLYCNNHWIRESALFPSSLTPYVFDVKSIERVEEDVLFLGYMSCIWGHAITDCLKHIWWFCSDEYKRDHKTKKIYYWGPKSLSGVYLELVKLAGIDINNLCYIDHGMLFRSIIVPDISFNYTDGFACKEYADTIDLIISNVKPYKIRIDKLFLSERESSRNWGVKSIEKVAISAGYKLYYPAEHSLQDQISVLRSANSILTFESSVGHNTVFCCPRTKLIMLRKEDYVNNYQSIINKLRSFEVLSINASLSIMNDDRFPYAGPFFVYPNDVVCQAIFLNNNQESEAQCSINNCNKFESLFPWRTFRKYIRYNLYNNEQVLTHLLTIPLAKAECLSHEITKYREQQLKQIQGFFKFFPLSKKIKEKTIRKILKYKVRHLF